MTKKKTSTSRPKAKKSTQAKPKPVASAKSKAAPKAKPKASVASAKSKPPSKSKAKTSPRVSSAKPKAAPKSKPKTTASPKTKAARASNPPAKKPARAASKTSEKKPSATGKGRAKTKSTGATPGKSADEGERKLRELASQSNPLPLEEEGKPETKGFSLEDVRSIISTRDDEDQKSETTDSKPSGAKASKKKDSSAQKAKSAKVKKIQTASVDDILGLGKSSLPSRPIRDEKKVPKAWLSYYRDLMTLRESLKGALGERSSETLGASARESSGELSLNSPDAGTETFNRDVALSMVASEQEALEEIEDAIDRIFDGTFGICQETQKPIKKTRLKVVPFTRFSLEGQNLYERRKRRDGEPVSGAFATISDSTMGEDD